MQGKWRSPVSSLCLRVTLRIRRVGVVNRLIPIGADGGFRKDEPMHAFTERLARRIEQAESATIAASLGDAAEIMRIWRFFGGDPARSAVVGPFSEDAEYPLVQADDIDRLKLALISFVRRHLHHPQLCSAIFAVYYLAAPDTKGLLIEVLRDCLGRDSHALYQTMLALEELGENLYGARGSRSSSDVELNERLARDYLASLRNEE